MKQVAMPAAPAVALPLGVLPLVAPFLVALFLVACDDEPGRPVERSAESVSDPTTSSAASQASSTDTTQEMWITADARRAVSADGTYRVAWAPIGGSIPDAEPFAIAIEVERVDGHALADDAIVLADAEMPHHGHGMNLVPVVKRASGAGRFVAEGMLLHMPGRWVLAVDVEERGVLERTQWWIDVE